MIIRHLAVEDFRVFSGRKEFNLEPKKKYGKSAPIVLFGGLNGAGKTSILTAVLTALYGRQALGLGTSRKAYESFLRESIHKAKNALIVPNASKIELQFSFANMGVITDYKIVRSWILNGAKVLETLKIYEGDSLIRDLSYDQAQAFLNELIPIGVSDLFFFDGEKIKDLAEDKTGKALADAIRKLLGLDLINRLSADLTLLLRDKEKQGADSNLLSTIADKEAELESAKQKADLLLNEFEHTKCSYVELEADLDRLNSELETAGGAWAKSRNALLEEYSELLGQKKAKEAHARQLLGEDYPLSLLSGHLGRIANRLEKEGQQSLASQANELVKKHESDLVERLLDLGELDETEVRLLVKSWREDALVSESECIRHDVSETQRGALIERIGNLASAKVTFEATIHDLKEIESEIDQRGVALSRAPDERALQEQFDNLKAMTEKRNQIHARLLGLKEERRKVLYQSIELARQLKALHERLKSSESGERTVNLGHAAKSMLGDFADRATAERVAQLEVEFTQSYARLARKEDHHITATIDPITFDVVLCDEGGKEINKNDLSAGEKQIYAIAILEALARTSGRNLPVIIDTPLGRLDSKHREKLRENYFPHASHQVIILSTDTEIDENFYSKLERSVSHAYQLEFDSVQKATEVNKGYFWRKGEEAA